MIGLTETPYRILIVEDEEGWIDTMRTALEYAAQDRKVPMPEVEAAANATNARKMLALRHYHLVSLDMRLPAAPSDTVSVESGIKIAEEMLSPLASLPKTIVYTATLDLARLVDEPFDGIRVIDRLPSIDKYTKASGADISSKQLYETLSQRQWANRVLDYLYTDELLVPLSGANKAWQTTVGAWLTGAVRALPPVLARHAQELENRWPAQGRKVEAGAVDAAFKFIEVTLRLALAQTGVLLAHQGQTRLEIPTENTLHAFVDTLERWITTGKAQLRGWNWRAHLDDAALAAFDAYRKLRNEARHGLGVNTAGQNWQAVRPVLRTVMDVAAYWAKHPLCGDLRYGRGGWRGEVFAGTSYPRPHVDLPGKDFPGDAVAGVWQTAIRRKDGEPGWEEVAISWEGWLRSDPRQERALYLASHRSPRGVVAMDLDSGDTGPLPSTSRSAGR